MSKSVRSCRELVENLERTCGELFYLKTLPYSAFLIKIIRFITKMSKNTTLLGIFKFFKFIENYLVTQNRAEKLFLQTLSENTTLLATILA